MGHRGRYTALITRCLVFGDPARTDQIDLPGLSHKIEMKNLQKNVDPGENQTSLNPIHCRITTLSSYQASTLGAHFPPFLRGHLRRFLLKNKALFLVMRYQLS